jgi:hypothetical protein
MEGPSYKLHQEDGPDYVVDTGRGKEKRSRRQRRPEHSRGIRPIVVNGIHRRRNKRWTW